MAMVKCNVVEPERTPAHEVKCAEAGDDWVKRASEQFAPKPQEDKHVNPERSATE